MHPNGGNAARPAGRDTTVQTLDVLIIGAGFGGLYALHKLRSAGLAAQAVDAAPSVGGTWWANRYPGARVDIQSLEYSFSFDEALQQEWRWSERYAAQPELLRYANHVADRFDLRRDIALGTRVVAARWDEAAACWEVEGQVQGPDQDQDPALGQAPGGSARTWRTRFIVMAIGPLSTPNLPAFEGLERFAGPLLHSANWPHGPVSFAERDVIVVGTGSSAVQMIPIIGAEARTLTVMQRTPAYVVPAHNGPLDRDYEARIKADYAGIRARNRRMFTGFGCELKPHPQPTLALSDAARDAAFEQRWRHGGFSLLGAFADTATDAAANEACAEFVRRKIRSIVRDPAVAQRLTPTYPIGCKRLCVDSGYYATFNRPNVKLVDVSTAPIERITTHGVVGGGHEFKADMLVLATGFDAFTGPLMRIDLTGRGGVHIRDKWAGGPLNYLGLAVAGFPNLFNLVGAGSTSAFTSVIAAIEHQVDWIAECLSWLRAQGHRSIEAQPQAERHWVEWVNRVASKTVMMNCSSWYLGTNIPGKPRMFMPLAGGFPAYQDRCAEAAREGYAGFDFG